MSKRKLSNKIFGENPWDVEVELSAVVHVSIDHARPCNNWIEVNGRPLAAAIKEGRRLHPEVLDFLATMIKRGPTNRQTARSWQTIDAQQEYPRLHGRTSCRARQHIRKGRQDIWHERGRCAQSRNSLAQESKINSFNYGA